MTDTLKSICEQCTHLSNPQLDFTPPDSPRQREILARDLQELIAAAATEREKSVVLLAGSVLEGILHSLIQSHQDYIAERRGTFNFDPTGDLQTYVNIFNRWLSDLTSVDLPDSIVAHRNLVHMNRELSSTPGICGTAALEMLRTLDSLLAALSELARP